MIRCARISDRGVPLVVETRLMPPTPPCGVLLKTLFGGVCRSDLHFIRDNHDLGDGKSFKFSEILGIDAFKRVVLGHEICGMVEELGAAAEGCGLDLGDTVIVYPCIGCDQCDDCQTGDYHLCDNNDRALSNMGSSPDRPGGFGDHVIVPHWKYVIRIPPNVMPSVACTLPCGALTAFHALKNSTDAVTRAAKVSGMARIIILGLGGLGTWCLQLARHVFNDVSLIIAAGDVKREKAIVAKRLGADRFIHWKKDATAEDISRAVTSDGKELFDVVIDFVGCQSTNGAAFRSLKKGGSLVSVGLSGGEMKVPISWVVTRSIRLQGMKMGSIKMLKELLHLAATKDITPPPISLFKLEEINVALEKLQSGELPGRAVIRHDITGVDK